MVGIAMIVFSAVSQASPADPPVGRRETHVMVDDSGKAWSSADLEKLRAFIKSRNTELAAGGRPIAKPATKSAATTNYGVDHTRVPKAREWRGGNDPEPASGPAPPPVDRIHLTAIGPTVEKAEQVVRGWRTDERFRALEEEFGDRLAIQAFAATNPIVADVGLAAGGSPDVVLQLGSGKVVFRSASDPGPSVLVGEIRRRDPSYDSSRDPGGMTTPNIVRIAIWVGVAALVLLLLKGRS
jgi:hypothetical protein